MASDDELIEAAPCPNCRSPLTVSATDLGHLVECPGCGTQFRARRMGPDAPPPPRRRDDDDPPPRRRPRDDDDDDRDRFGEERPRRTSGRSRFDDDDDRDRDYDDRPRKRKTPGALVALAVMDFIYGGILLICGVIQGVGLAFRNQLQAGGGAPMNVPRELLLAFGYLGTAIILIFAGVMALGRKGYGLSVTAMLSAALMLVVGLVAGVMNIQEEQLQQQRMGVPQQPGEELGVFCFVAMLSVFWLGYLVTNGILLSKSGRHFR